MNKIKVNFIIDNYLIEYWKIKSIQELTKNPDFDVHIYLTNQIKSNSRLISKNLFFVAFYKLILLLEFKLLKLNSEIITKFSIYDINEFVDKINQINNDSYPNLNNQSNININFTEHSNDEFCEFFPVDKFWSILFGKSKFSNSFPGLIEVKKQSTTCTISIIQTISTKNSNKFHVLNSSHSRVDKTSIASTLQFAYAKVPKMIEKCLINVSKNEELGKHKIDSLDIIGFQNIIVYFISFLCKYILKIFNKIDNFFYMDQWILMFQLNQNTKKNNFDFKSYQEILPPKDRIWADPFVFKKNGIYHVYIEELIINEGKGFISHFKIDKNGKYTKPKKVIEESYHLSFPFLFEDDGNLYMLPETNKNRTISLYKCIDFPLKWKFEMHLIEDIDANDSTIIHKDGKFWILTNVKTNKFMSCDDELHIFYSEKLLSKSWRSHLQNPVVSDVKSSRPAGKLFWVNDELIRPSQNCSKHYGYGINFQKICDFDTKKYSESEYEKITPNWNRKINSIHTYNSTNNLTVIDVQKRRFRY